MEGINRREFLEAAAAAPVLLQTAAGNRAGLPARGLYVCMHGITSDAHDYRTMMEGWAKAGIKAVEPSLLKVREFAEKESPATAKRLLDDLGLTPVSTSNQLGLPEPGDQRLESLEQLKWKVELAQAIGADRIVCPSAGPGTFTEDDYKRGVDHMREAGEIARPFGVSVMLECARSSHFVASLPTALTMVRAANHPNVKVMLDTYHFWGGPSKFEDLELLRNGELHHLHFEDVPTDPPREMQGQPHRAYPGEGIAPLRRIIQKLQEKGYSGPVSLEMFHPDIQAASPYEIARKARATIEPFLT